MPVSAPTSMSQNSAGKSETGGDYDESYGSFSTHMAGAQANITKMLIEWLQNTCIHAASPWGLDSSHRDICELKASAESIQRAFKTSGQKLNGSRCPGSSSTSILLALSESQPFNGRRVLVGWHCYIAKRAHGMEMSLQPSLKNTIFHSKH